jgi:hypothetical protein
MTDSRSSESNAIDNRACERIAGKITDVGTGHGSVVLRMEFEEIQLCLTYSE